jgi:outer membrane receptor protein involved in Fe transport
VNRTETVADFIDLRVSKRFRVALWSFDAALDIYNITNANPVLSQNTAVGSTLGRPTTILAPRIVRLNFTAKF